MQSILLISGLKNAVEENVGSRFTVFPCCIFYFYMASPLNTGMHAGKIMIKRGCEESRKLLEKEGLDMIEVELTELTAPNNIGSLHCLTCPIIRGLEPSA